MQLVPFFVLMAAVSSQSTNIYQCQANGICGCGRGADSSRELVCPKITAKNPEPKLKLQIWPQKAAILECQSTNEVQYDWLSGNIIGQVKVFTIVGCSMPLVSLGDFLTNLGVSGLQTLTLRAIESNNGTLFTRQSLRGLGNVKELRMYSFNKLSLTAGMFGDMDNLTLLDFRDDNLNLLGDVFYNLKNLKRLELANVNLTYLEPGIFKPLVNLKMLNIWGNTLHNVTKETFSGLSNLTSLGLSSNAISTLPEDTFTELSKLKNLSLYGNNFTSLSQGFFSSTPFLKQLKLNSNRKTLTTLPKRFLANLTALTEIYMQDCNISYLPQDLIWESVNISVLQLSTNSIQNLPKLIFRDAKNLKQLDLSNNKLESLPDNVFVSLEKLQILHLDHNRLTTLNEAMLQGLSNVKILSLNNNALIHIDLDTFRSTHSLSQLYMSNNHIAFNKTSDYEYSDIFGRWSPLQHCLKLEVLHLVNNSITEIFSDWRITLLKLNVLDLRHNLIKRIEFGDLNFVSNNLTVDLGYNQISTIDLMNAEAMTRSELGKSESVHHNVTIKLDGNPLQCDCDIYFFLKYLEHRLSSEVYHLMTLLPENLRCASPEDKADISLTKLHSRTITCQLSQDDQSPVACPQQCSCFIRPENRALIVDCNNARLKNVPPELPQNVQNIELILDNNLIQSLPTSLPKGYTNVRKLSLSHNNITWLSNESLSTNLKELHLDHNNLTRINSSLFKLWENKTNLTLHGNPWICDCDAWEFFNFLQINFKQVEYLNNVTCVDGRSLARLTAKDICPLLNNMVVALSVTIAVIGIIIGLLAAVYFRYQNEVKIWLYAHNMCLQFVTEEELDKDKIYDAFISYSHKDEEFVANKLLPGLEYGPTKFKLCVHFRDWIAGEFITTQITRSVQESRRTLVVLSPNFIKSEWGRLEFRAAHKQALSEGRARVIVVIYGELGSINDLDSELQAYLTTNTYVKWGDPWFWDKLRYALPHPPKSRKGIMSNNQPQKSKDDKIELVNPSTPPAVTTPPTDVINNPLLQVGNGYINHGCNKIMQENGHMNDAVKCV